MAIGDNFISKANALQNSLQGPASGVTISYAGKELPRDEVPYLPPAADPTNDPAIITIGGITLPADTQITVNGEKAIVSDTILDGPPVFERISTKPVQVDFEGTIRSVKIKATSIFSPPQVLVGDTFPQDAAVTMWEKVFAPNSVLVLKNTYLNKLGIQELVVISLGFSTVRGNTNVPFRLKTYMNVQGQSLVIAPNEIVLAINVPN